VRAAATARGGKPTGDYSLVILVGRLTRDPELKYGSAGGLPYTTLSVAVTKQVPQDDGSLKKTVSYIDATVWRHQAELCAQLLKKGSTCMIVGSLQQAGWTDTEGKNRSRPQVMAERVQFLDRKVEVPVPISPDAEASNDEQ